MVLKLDGHGVFAYILGALGVSHGVLTLGDRLDQPIRNRNARFFLFAVISIGSLIQFNDLVSMIRVIVAFIFIAVLAKLVLLPILILGSNTLALGSIVGMRIHIQSEFHRL